MRGNNLQMRVEWRLLVALGSWHSMG